MVHFTSLILATAAVVGSVAAAPEPDVNPFQGKDRHVVSSYGKKLEQTIAAFQAKNDTLHAARTRTVQQKVSTFTWVTSRAHLSNITTTIAEARQQKKKGKDMIVGLVLYNLPDRDCSAGESAGELQIDSDGYRIYKSQFVDKYAKLVKEAKDLTFAIVLEPDSLGNAVTNQGIEACAKATPIYEQGIAYAISKLQAANIHLYIDAAHGGWLGWADNLKPTAQVFAKVVAMAKKLNPASKIRGYATNVSNYNSFNAKVRENYTEYSPSWDESHYASALAPYLEAEGLPSKFIIDQGRVAMSGAREAWGEWCNVSPSGFGPLPSTKTDNAHVDSLVWIKPGGESDGRCGLEGAPAAGAWFDEYVQMLVKNADPPLEPTYKKV
ncbi:Cellulose 1,4-beta-cellobiosidase (non-reducing end) [Ascochyta rabiei]|uniref:Glucanase n=1 Tax=Didymella rabiei TaxID=5454 RepID=A0A162WVX1_DIDRA|nr:Cellulose 1,4-beta-cellobiosidase (non-reducing end) [Ascochyta rabiei]KZM19232.1 hydrolase [Ascochyta rabiei]UPX16979.1 Cellulose 1,4-beta-cellobiosidase (non-reducing end) [Ascochyta rabiei]